MADWIAVLGAFAAIVAVGVTVYNAKSGKGKGEQKEQIQQELMPGEYHILVRGHPSTESNTRDQYLLTVTQP